MQAFLKGWELEKAGKGTDKNEKIVVRIHKRQEATAAPLFSSDEVRRFVTEFVSSWIRGDLIIRFPTAAELSKKTPLSIAFPIDPSVDAELKIKEHYVDLISVVAGIKKASSQEHENAIAEVFKMLLMFRSANRIQGKIISNDLEKRVGEIERNLEAQSRLVEKITAFLFKPKKNKSRKPA